MDRPGITAGLMGVLTASGASLLDVEQIVVRGRLTLDILINVGPQNTVIKDLLFYGWENDLRLDFEVVEDAPSEVRSRSVVTVIGPRRSRLVKATSIGSSDCRGIP